MNNAKYIAEIIIKEENARPAFKTLAYAYLDLEKQFEAALVEIQHLKENNNVPAHMLKFGLKEGVEYE